MPKRRRRGFDPYLDPDWQPSGEPGWWRAKNFPMGKWGMIIEDWPSEIAIERYNQQLNRYNRELEKWYKGGQKGDAPKKPVLPARPPKSYDPGMPSRVAQKLFGKEAVQQRFKEWLAGHPELGPQPREGVITPEQYEAWQESPFYREWADTQFYPGGSPGGMKIETSMDRYKQELWRRQQEQIEAIAARDQQRAIERGDLPTPPMPTSPDIGTQTTQEGEIMPNFGMPRRRRQPLGGESLGGAGQFGPLPGFGSIRRFATGMMPGGGRSPARETGYSPVLTPERQTGFNPALRPRRRYSPVLTPEHQTGFNPALRPWRKRGFDPTLDPDYVPEPQPSPQPSPSPAPPYDDPYGFGRKGQERGLWGPGTDYADWGDRMRAFGMLPADYLTGIWPPRSRSMAMRGQALRQPSHLFYRSQY